MDRVRKAHGAEEGGLTDGNRRSRARNLALYRRLELKIHDESPIEDMSRYSITVVGVKRLGDY